MNQINVYKGRTNIVPVSLGYDVSADTIFSEIRAKRDRTSELIATWDVQFATDGTDGELLLVLDDAVTETIEKTIGYMDLKRVTAGEPVNVFDDVLEVAFRGTVTQ